MWFPLALAILVMFSSRPVVTLWPSTTAPIASGQFARLDGYGLKLQTRKLSLGYYKTTYTSHESSKLLQLEGTWVNERQVDFWEANYSFYENRDFALGFGLNKADEERIGWQIYAENNFGNLIFARLGFRRVWLGKPVNGIVASFGVNIAGAIKLFVEKELNR